MRTILMFAVHLWTVLGALLAPVTAAKIIVAWVAVRRELKRRGDTPPMFTLSPYGLKAFGGAFAAPTQIFLFRALTFYIPIKAVKYLLSSSHVILFLSSLIQSTVKPFNIAACNTFSG